MKFICETTIFILVLFFNVINLILYLYIPIKDVPIKYVPNKIKSIPIKGIKYSLTGI